MAGRLLAEESGAALGDGVGREHRRVPARSRGDDDDGEEPAGHLREDSARNWSDVPARGRPRFAPRVVPHRRDDHASASARGVGVKWVLAATLCLSGCSSTPPPVAGAPTAEVLIMTPAWQEAGEGPGCEQRPQSSDAGPVFAMYV